MQNKLFHGLIATFVLITVSIPDITLAGNRQPETWTSLRRQCIHRQLQKRAEDNPLAKPVLDTFTRRGEGAIPDEYNLNEDQRQIFRSAEQECKSRSNEFQISNDTELYLPNEFENSNMRERPRRMERNSFFSRTRNYLEAVERNIREEHNWEEFKQQLFKSAPWHNIGIRRGVVIRRWRVPIKR